MKILYFDTFAGASGDMILGAMVDAGLNFSALKSELDKLDLHGYEIDCENLVSKGISGTRVSIKTTEDHHHRGLTEINRIIDDSGLSDSVKVKSKKIFRRLGEAEAKIHNKSVDEIHFHEVGAVDSILDIVGSAVGFDLLGIDKAYSSELITGRGTVDCAHGKLPVPAPATLELLEGIPFSSGEIETELLTPTGAAVITTMCENYGRIPSMKSKSVGYGFGTKELPVSNFLRIIIGEEEVKDGGDTISVIETNIDDMNPEFYDYILEKLFEQGAKDVYLQQIIMKKNRPGVILSIICSEKDIEVLTDILFAETTTLGVRISEMKKRRIAVRKSVEAETEFGRMLVKTKEFNGKKILMPEYEECKRIAKEKSIPIKDVYSAVEKLNLSKNL